MADLESDRQARIAEAENEVALFGNRISPAPAVIDQDHWDLLRLAGTLDEKKKHIFLRVVAETANLKLACQSAGYRNMAAINRALRDDIAFYDAFQEASKAAGDFIEAEATRRAMQGVKKAVYYKGEIIDYEITYSDSLLTLLLKAAKPDKYADRSKNETNVNVRVGIAVLPMKQKSVKEWEAQSGAVHAAQKLLDGPAPVDADFEEVTPGPTKLSRG